jgi:hypothetical protein
MKISNQPDLSSLSAPIEQLLSLNDFFARAEMLLINGLLTVFADLPAFYDMPEDFGGHQPHYSPALTTGDTAGRIPAFAGMTANHYTTFIRPS